MNAGCVQGSYQLEGRGEGVSVEEGETPLDPPLHSRVSCSVS